jgi:hypothetical protein
VNWLQANQDGNYPESLKQLTPNYLEEVPRDPIDGQPMRYAASKKEGGFRLWSIGLDGVDDNGALSLQAEEPERTRLDRDTYIDDRPWPTAPDVFVRPPRESE